MAGSGRRDLATPLAARILVEIRDGVLAVGTHLRSQDIATRFGVSRFPVGQALQILADKGVLRHERNRGYFVQQASPPSSDALGLSEQDGVTQAYFRIADDHLRGKLPEQVSEADLRQSYGTTRA